MAAREHVHTIISALAREGTIGREHLMNQLDLVKQSEFIYVP
tara:strand:- start:97 stop:222 length:126 start_codon:yes stop_codon:yes gene_type:complete